MGELGLVVLKRKADLSTSAQCACPEAGMRLSTGSESASLAQVQISKRPAATAASSTQVPESKEGLVLESRAAGVLTVS